MPQFGKPIAYMYVSSLFVFGSCLCRYTQDTIRVFDVGKPLQLPITILYVNYTYKLQDKC